MASSLVGDCIIAGGGIVGLSVARALQQRGAKVLLSAPTHRGFASAAAAGILAPTIAPFPGPALSFSEAARAFYPRFAEALLDETGVDVELALGGVLRVATTQEDALFLRPKANDQAQ